MKLGINLTCKYKSNLTSNIYIIFILQEAADLGKKVAVLDFVKPSPVGTTWGQSSSNEALYCLCCWYC